jgi:hypothetical protein
MVCLVYQSRLFGPLRFEYSKARIRVGSCRDNDLVIPHPSLQPYHCALVLEEDYVSVLPPNAREDFPLDHASQYAVGNDLVLGEVVFSIERSSSSVATPTIAPAQPSDGRTDAGFWKADFEGVPDAARWLCSRCGLRFEDVQVSKVGLVGKAKHIHCPTCGWNLTQVLPATPERPGTMRRRLAAMARKWLKQTGLVRTAQWNR